MATRRSNTPRSSSATKASKTVCTGLLRRVRLRAPLGLGDFAKAAGYTNAGDKPQPFNGYYFQILTKQGDKAPGGAKDYIVDGKMTGGFAILAYPAEYRNSGIMTFIVDKDGTVYQKDLGEKTTDLAVAMTEYNPSDGWDAVVGTETAKNQGDEYGHK